MRMLALALMCTVAACSDSEVHALRRPGHLAFTGLGELLVADLQGHRMVRFGPDGGFRGAVGEVGIGRNQLWNVRGMTTLPDGGFAIVGQSLESLDDGTSFVGEVKVFDSDGQERLRFDPAPPGTTEYSTADSITLVPEGFLVTDDEHTSLQIFTRSGRFVRNLEARAPAPPLAAPSCARYTNGRVWVTEYRVHRVRALDLDGNVTLTLGAEGSGPGQLKFPEMLDVAPDGTIAVADVGNFRAALFHPDGSWAGAITPAPAHPGTRPQIVDVRFGPDGNVYLSDGKGGRVLVYTRDGTLIRVIASW